MRNYTTIQVSNETKHRIKSLAISPTESYENIILRLLDTKLHGREINYLIKDKNSNHELKVKIDWGKNEKNILYYDTDGDLKFKIPTKDDEKWETFTKNIKKLTNLINILASLDENENIDAGELTLYRI